MMLLIQAIVVFVLLVMVGFMLGNLCLAGINALVLKVRRAHWERKVRKEMAEFFSGDESCNCVRCMGARGQDPCSICEFKDDETDEHCADCPAYLGNVDKCDSCDERECPCCPGHVPDAEEPRTCEGCNFHGCEGCSSDEVLPKGCVGCDAVNCDTCSGGSGYYPAEGDDSDAEDDACKGCERKACEGCSSRDE